MLVEILNESKNIVENEEFVYLEDKIVLDTDCAKSEMVTYIAFSEDVTQMPQMPYICGH
jgi:hypothetical protein